MVLLNLFHSNKKLLLSSIAFFLESASAGSLSLFNPLDTPKQPKRVYVNTQTLLANDAYSLQSLFHNFHGHFFNKNSDYLAIKDIRYDIGSYVQKWGYIGYSYRNELIIKSSPDTIKLIHKVHNNLDLPLNKKYKLNIAIEGFESRGVIFAKTVTLLDRDDCDIRLGFGGELLYGTGAQHGSATGEAEAVGKKSYTFSLRSFYLYTKNHLYHLDVNSVQTFGYTTHLSFYAHYKNFLLSIIANDIYGKLYWNNLPYSDVKMASRNKSYDKNGYAKYAPIISGIERSTTFTQKLMQKWQIQAAYTLGKGVFTIGVEHLYGIYMPYIQYTRRYSKDIVANVEYETYFGMFGIDIKYKNYSIGLHTNGLLNASSAKVNLGLYCRF